MTPLHGVGGRQDLPLPFGLVVLASALVVTATFAVVLRSWGDARWVHPAGRPLPRLTRVIDAPLTRWLGRGLVLTPLTAATLALVAGPDRVSNPFPGFVFVWVWVGLVACSLLLGRVWAPLHPVRALLAWRGGMDATEPLPRAGVWPATVAITAFAFLELVQPDRATTGVLRWWALAWLIWTLGGAALLGGRWLASADPFEAYASTVARMSPWQRINGVICWVNPLRQVSSTPPNPGHWVLALVLLGSTAFDSLGSSLAWVRWAQTSPIPRVLTGAGGLLVVISVTLVAYRLGARWLDRFSPGGPPLRSWHRLAPSLIPLMVGYALAHYATLLVLEGQRVAITLSDPLGRGDNLFGTAELGVNTTLVDHPSIVASWQVVALVGGHVLGVICAHDLAVRWIPRSEQTRAQLGILAVMVAYTCAGLLLLFAS